jgi:hypothetical protein
MLKFFAGLTACFVVLCAACADRMAASDWPAGSRVVGSVCFEHAVGDQWEPAQLRLADGALPVKRTAIVGSAYFTMDAGQLRLRSCP